MQQSGNLSTGSKNNLSVYENFAMINPMLQFLKMGVLSMIGEKEFPDLHKLSKFVAILNT